MLTGRLRRSSVIDYNCRGGPLWPPLRPLPTRETFLPSRSFTATSIRRTNMQLQNLESYPKQCTPADRNGRQELNKVKLSGLTLTETLHAPSSSMPAHVHDAASICVTLTGQGIEIIDGVRLVTEPGCVI